MAATDLATLFLDPDMRINRFTPRLAHIFNVVSGDEGRPISDFTNKLKYNDLTRDGKRVLADLTTIEKTIESTDGRWFLLRVRPYRTLDDRIEGVVVTFVDITEQRKMEERWRASAPAARRAVAPVQEYLRRRSGHRRTKLARQRRNRQRTQHVELTFTRTGDIL